MGQTHDAEVGRKNHFYCYMFCEEVQGICGSSEPQTRLDLHSQIAPSDSNVDTGGEFIRLETAGLRNANIGFEPRVFRSPRMRFARD